MPTSLDKALNSRNLFFGFAGLVALASLSSMFGGDMFPAQGDPKGGPETWTDDELRRWLKNRDNFVSPSSMTREDLIERVKAKLRDGGRGK